MEQNAKIKAARAVSAVIIHRYTIIPLTIFSIVGITALVTSFILALTHSSWWIIMLLAILVLTIPGLLAAAVTLLIYGKLMPRRLSKDERREIKKLVNNITSRYASLAGPKKHPFILSATIAWKLALHRNKKSTQDIILKPINDTKNLGRQFNHIVGFFD